MFKGGYQGVDFTGYSLSETPVTIPGLYNLLITCGKPIIVSGIEGLRPIFIAGSYVEGGSLIIPIMTLVSNSDVSQYQIVITDEDAVTLAEAKYPAN